MGQSCLQEVSAKRDSKRRLITVLACRAEGSRLYGKPLQNLNPTKGVTILDQIISSVKRKACISSIVLAVSDGVANEPFHGVAHKHAIGSIHGDPQDVLQRLIQGCRAEEGTDVFRVTTESPFMYHEAVEEAWERHVQHGNDVTAVDGLPEGAHFEIYTLRALEESHKLGDSRHRSELCSLYIREHRSDFKVEAIPVPKVVCRPELRLTVDYPEDLALCRAVYLALAGHAPLIPMAEIIRFLDSHPTIKALAEPYAKPEWLWLTPEELAQCP
ncbi:MAG: acylneuraminate cytidylyltransferase [Actinobacteria bacterium]|nr:acylneuraminate cytidylyltransferase [Actinomycetota bacterium]